MKRILFGLVFLPVIASAGIGDGAKSPVAVGGFAFPPKTLAQLVAYAPARLGEVYFCTTCSPAKGVISTGTLAGNFADMVGATFK